MSLTTTSTLALRSELITSLSLTSATIITDSPNRPNIFYNVVHTSQKENPQIFHSLVLELNQNKQQTPRSIFFCRTHRQCRSLYSYLHDELGSKYKQYFAMFHSTIDDNIWKSKCWNHFQTQMVQFKCCFARLHLVWASIVRTWRTWEQFTTMAHQRMLMTMCRKVGRKDLVVNLALQHS